jgi:hypothetical protein
MAVPTMIIGGGAVDVGTIHVFYKLHYLHLQRRLALIKSQLKGLPSKSVSPQTGAFSGQPWPGVGSSATRNP